MRISTICGESGRQVALYYRDMVDQLPPFSNFTGDLLFYSALEIANRRYGEWFLLDAKRSTNHEGQSAIVYCLESGEFSMCLEFCEKESARERYIDMDMYSINYDPYGSYGKHFSGLLRSRPVITAVPTFGSVKNR